MTTLSRKDSDTLLLQRSRDTNGEQEFGAYWYALWFNDRERYWVEAPIYEANENLASAGQLKLTSAYGETYPLSDDPHHSLPTQHHPPL